MRGNVRLAWLECCVTSQIFAHTVIITSSLYIKCLQSSSTETDRSVSTVATNNILVYKKVGKAQEFLLLHIQISHLLSVTFLDLKNLKCFSYNQ